MRAMLRSTRSMSMTAAGVPYSRAILAARAVVMSVGSNLMFRHREQWNDEAIQFAHLTLDRVAYAHDDGSISGSRLFDLLTQQFKLEPSVLCLVQLILRFRKGGSGPIEFPAILAIEVGIVQELLLSGDFRLQGGDGLRQGFQRVLFVEIEPAFWRALGHLG